MRSSKAYWGYDEKFLDEFMDIFKVTNNCLNKSFTYLVYLDKKVIGYYSLLPKDQNILELDMFFIEPMFIGQGFGRTLWELACQTSKELGYLGFNIIADPNADSFYIRMGCTKIGDKKSAMSRERNINIFSYDISASAFMPQSIIIIRDYIESDAREIAEIFYNTIHIINIKDYSQKQINVWAPKSKLDTDWWDKRSKKLKPFIATINNKVVGFAELESNGHIDCFYCHYDYQGLGVGSALINYIEKNANDKKIEKLYAEVSITAKPFFLSKGFAIVKEQNVEKEGVKLKNYIMEKLIN